jgi:hypothetical protein
MDAFARQMMLICARGGGPVERRVGETAGRVFDGEFVVAEDGLEIEVPYPDAGEDDASE